LSYGHNQFSFAWHSPFLFQSVLQFVVVLPYSPELAINSANRAVACLVQYVNTVEQNAFQTFTEMKEHMAEKAKTNQTTNATDSSDDEYNSESDDNSDD